MIKQGMNILKENEKKRLDFNPELKQINFLDRRVYKRSEGVYYPSVTTILQYMPKNKFFEGWLKDVGHNADYIMKKVGKEGTQVHEAAEKLVLGEEVAWMDDYGNAKYSQIVWEMILKFAEFWKTNKPELISSEDFGYPKETDEFWNLLQKKFKYKKTSTVFIDDSKNVLDFSVKSGLNNVFLVSNPDSNKEKQKTDGYKSIDSLVDFSKLII